jgi:hypothetical protein
VCLPHLNFAIRRPEKNAVLEYEIYSKSIMTQSEVSTTINLMLEKGLIKLKKRKKRENLFLFYYPNEEAKN